MKKILFFCAMFSLVSAGAFGETGGDVKNIKDQINKFAPVKIVADKNLLKGNDKKVIEELVLASHYIHEIFTRQVWEGNVELRKKLVAEGKNSETLLEYFDINVGPFDRLDHNNPFVPGVADKPLGAGFYPSDLTKKEFEGWLKKHPEDKAAFENSLTVIKRKGKDLIAVPYSEEYRDLLEKAAEHMKRAAKYSGNASFKKYLLSRAEAFLTNDYFQSDVDWVSLKDHTIEAVVGPYEVYEDEMFNYKAAFESFITLVDKEESARLVKIGKMIGELENYLPVDEEFKGRGRNLESPIVVAQQVYTAGDARRGVNTIAFNLPNDEKVRKEYGSKKVMLKNVMHAKFDKILIPIAKVVMKQEDVENTKFDAFFAQVLLHEISHGIGPGEIVVKGVKTTVDKALKDTNMMIEETKADTLGVYNNIYLAKKGLYSKDFEKTVLPTYLAGIFRSVRFGISEAHGGSNVIQFNYIWDKGGFTYDAKTGLFGVNYAKIDDAIKSLAHDLLMIEAKGDYEGAKAFIKKYCVMRPELKKSLEKLTDVPVDIKPIFEYK